SKAGRYMMRRPAYRELKTAAMPAMWYEGTQISWASVGSQPRNSTLEMMYETRWRWRRIAALGSDVVPLVKSSTATSSGSTKGCSPVRGSAMAASNAALVMTLVA